MSESITLLHKRYRLHTRKQLPNEDFENFLHSLRTLVKACHYLEQEEEMLRDHIVFGINDIGLQKVLLYHSELTLETAVAMCRDLQMKKPVVHKLNTTKSSKKFQNEDATCSGLEHSKVFISSNKVEEVFVQIDTELIKAEPPECDNCEPSANGPRDIERNDSMQEMVGTSNITDLYNEHRCCLCEKQFISISHLKKHETTCNKRRENGQYSEIHELRHCKKKQFECNNCSESFSKKEQIQKHMNSPGLHQNIDSSMKNAGNTEEMREHNETKNLINSDCLEEIDFYFKKPARTFRCTICSKGYFIKHSLTSHMLTHSAEKPHKCDECNKSFSTKGHLKEHLMIHKSVKPYQCEVCSKSFLRKWNFNQHMLIHKGDQRYQCNFCSKTFAIKDYLKKHSLTHTDKYSLIHASTKAEVTVASKLEEKSYFCEPCNKGFTTKQFLERHLISHKDELLSSSIAGSLSRYQCSTCRKIFSAKRALEVHTLTHTGSRPHQCHICSKSFSQKGSLNLHLLIHSGERPHKCQVCGKSFLSKDYLLNKHMLTHTGERPFCCDSCGKRFAVKCNLNKHMRIHKMQTSFQCDVCQNKYTRKQDLLKHMHFHQRTPG